MSYLQYPWPVCVIHTSRAWSRMEEPRSPAQSDASTLHVSVVVFRLVLRVGRARRPLMHHMLLCRRMGTNRLSRNLLPRWRYAQEIVHHKEWADESLMRDGVLMKNSVCLPRTPAFIPAPGAQIRAAEIFTPVVPAFRELNAS